MSIEVKPENYYYGMWYIPPGTESPGMDWMACMWKEPDGSLHNTYRFRYYASDDPWDQQDVKSWYTMDTEAGKTEEEIREVVQGFNGLAQTLAEMTGSRVCFIKMEVLGEEAGKILTEAGPSWMHTKKFDNKEEADEYLKGL